MSGSSAMMTYQSNQIAGEMHNLINFRESNYYFIISFDLEEEPNDDPFWEQEEDWGEDW